MALPVDPIAELRRCLRGRKYHIGWHAVQHMFRMGSIAVIGWPH